MKVLTPIEANGLIAELEKERNIQLKEEVRKKIILYSDFLDDWVPPLFDLLVQKPEADENEIYDYLNTHYWLEKYLKDSPPLFQKYLESRGIFSRTTIVKNNLTEIETKILNVLATNGEQTVSRDTIAKAIWSKNWLEKYSDWMIDTEIYNLKRKLKNSYRIEPVRNKGYKLIKKDVLLHTSVSEEKVVDKESALFPHTFYIEYMNNSKNVRKTLYDLFGSLGKTIIKTIRAMVSKQSEINILVINSYSADNVDAVYKWSGTVFKNRPVNIYFGHYDKRSIQIHQKRIEQIGAKNIFSVFDDINNTKLKPNFFNLAINDFRLNFNRNHAQNLLSMDNLRKIIKPRGLALISVVVDTRYESKRYGNDQKKAPINKNKPWTFEADEKLPRFCFTVPYYKMLFEKSGFKIKSEFDIKEGKKWVKNLKSSPKFTPTFRRFLLKKIG